ncbi:MAG TPA: response regulator [Amycolatopsis sp.]|uniref:response regulator n=1 Tax=Amycolatopsis sp. TaxID=37632 RepID=UPI002B46529C|nr:response regulator [Amycolatopsis sp.]HKS43831.1 response regulator [Amycolatopsis sp.]
MIRLLVVEDDLVAAEAHREYVKRVNGFEVAGVVHSGADALRFCEREAVDLVLLDFYLPDTHGLAVCRALRAAGSTVDVIAVTSARDLAVVKAAVSVGVVQYLLKPFTFASFREKLERYAEFRRSAGHAADQTDVDRALATLRPSAQQALPKGMSGQTLDAIVAALRAEDNGLSAGAAASATGVSRVTARRYLEYLADNGLAKREPRYGQVGRPEVWYRPVN